MLPLSRKHAPHAPLSVYTTIILDMKQFNLNADGLASPPSPPMWRIGRGFLKFLLLLGFATRAGARRHELSSGFACNRG